jgi:uncharacterized protein (TIGR02246 family)
MRFRTVGSVILCVPLYEDSQNIGPHPQEAAMRRLAVAVTIATGVFVTVMLQGQGKIDPELKLAPQWAAAFNAKDAAKIASLYAADAVVMPPNQPTVKGRANIEAHWKGEIQQGGTNMQLNPVESSISGSLAFEAGTSTVILPGGQTERGKYLAILKRVGNEWKIAYDIYNTDGPRQK